MKDEWKFKIKNCPRQITNNIREIVTKNNERKNRIECVELKSVCCKIKEQSSFQYFNCKYVTSQTI